MDCANGGPTIEPLSALSVPPSAVSRLSMKCERSALSAYTFSTVLSLWEKLHTRMNIHPHHSSKLEAAQNPVPFRKLFVFSLEIKKGRSADPILQDGDVIVVPEAWF